MGASARIRHSQFLLYSTNAAVGDVFFPGNRPPVAKIYQKMQPVIEHCIYWLYIQAYLKQAGFLNESAYILHRIHFQNDL